MLRRSERAHGSHFGQFASFTRQQRVDTVARDAADLGLVGAIGAAPPTQYDADADEFQLLLEAELLEARDQRLARHCAPDGLRTALEWYRRFRAAFPNRVNWHAPDGPHGTRATELNNRTFELFAEFVRRHGSVKPGQRGATLTAGHISGIVSTLRAFRSRTAGFNMRDPQANLRLPSQFKDMRREDGPRAPDTSLRARREGFRAQHFAAAAAGGFDRHSRVGISKWCSMHSGHNGVARGGDLSGVARASDPFDPLRGTTCHHGEGGVEFVDLEETGTGLPGLFLWIFPCKDTNRTHVKHPVPVSARSSRVFDADYDDPLDPYLAILREWRCMQHEVPLSQRAVTPFFRRAGSTAPLLTADLAACIGEAWAAAGVTAAHSLDFAHDARIGGACDLRDQHGLHGRELLRQRGRWAGDIGWIYAHVSATQHFQASVDMGSASGRSIQSLATSWVHPAVTPQWDDGRDRHR